MPNWNQIVRKHLAVLRLPPEREIEIVEELALHLEAAYEDALADGLSETEAEARAVQGYDWRLMECELGRAEQPAQAQALQPALELIERKGGIRMGSLIQDLRFGVRMLMKNPVFTLITVLTLTLGIGANTAIFSVVNAVLLRPLPYKDASRLMVLWERERNIEQESPSYPNFLDWQAQSRSFEQMALSRRDNANLTGVGEPERLDVRQVSANFFATLGVTPLLGRSFAQEEDRVGANPVAVIGHGLWRRRFAADAEIINKTITLNDQPFTVIGVLPPEFQFYGAADVFVSINLMLPERLRQERGEHGGVIVVGRLKPGVTEAQAAAEMENIAVNLERQYPRTNTTNRVLLRSIREDQTGNVKLSLWLLLGAVGFVLLMACVNVANLSLARAAARQKEFAMRAALGATQARVMRQLLTESALLALCGGAFGLLLSTAGKDLLTAGLANDLPWLVTVPLDANVLLFAFAASLSTGAVFGLLPALQCARPHLTETLKDGAKGSSGARQSVRSGLVVAEVALALLLLISAGLMLRSFASLNRIDAGFDTRNLLTMVTMLSPTRYTEASKVRGFYEELQRRIQSLPGVQAVAYSTSVPLSGANQTSVVLEGQQFTRVSDLPLAVNSVVSADYFRAMGITLRRGRLFTPQDTTKSGGLVAVIDENMARDLFAGKDPLGQVFLLDGGTLRVTVVGVVNHIHHLSYEAEDQVKVKYQFYTSLSQTTDQFVARIMTNLYLIVRSEQDPTNLVASVRAQVFAIDREQLVYNARTMEQIIARTLGQRRFLMFLLTLFAGVAITLAVVGIYGVTSYAVTQRIREIGIRLALGATTGAVLRLILTQGLKLTLSGVALGMAAAFGLTRWMKTLLYGVGTTDPLTFAVVASLLIAVALLACWIPARRATKVDPLTSLRHE
jgi:putative ABC transport system permease protein